MIKDNKIAVLIDGDNIPSKYIKEMMEEIAKYGTPTIKRIYGDWTKPYLTKWKQVDILYSEKVDGFCLVSSDSDFTKLATRLREAAMVVYGMGEKKTPNPFIVACDKFIYLEILANDDTDEDVKDDKTKKPKKENLYNITPKVIKLLKNSVDDAADDDGWAISRV